MQRNNTPVLLIAIVLGVLALGATAFLMFKPAATVAPVAGEPGGAPAATPTPAPVARYVASRDIPPRTVLDSTMLRRDFAPGAAPTDSIQSLGDVAGQLTREPIFAGETVQLSSFTPRLNRRVDANIPIPPNFRGVAIYVDPAQTAAGLVDVGDHVDVISTNRLTYDKAPRQFVVGALNFTTGRTIAQNLLVLAVDSSISAPAPTPTPIPGAPAVPAAAPTPVPPPAPPASGPTRTRVLLAASPEIAARLIAANDQGTLHVTIRNPDDGDAGVVPEAREYPSSIYTAPKEIPAGNGSNDGSNAGSGNNSGGGRSMPSMAPMPPLPPPVKVPNPGNMGIPTTPMPMGTVAPPTQEITVIRGTEKTRVIVPQR